MIGIYCISIHSTPNGFHCLNIVGKALCESMQGWRPNNCGGREQGIDLRQCWKKDL